MEYLDTYDENKNYLGKQSRDYVHTNGLWHKTVHCWLYDKLGRVYFQIRADEKNFYTTASGHVLAGETIKEAFGREIKEEIGIDINYEKAELVNEVIWKMDKIKKDGTIFKDRVFACVYVNEIEPDFNDFHFDIEEVEGIVKVDAKEVLELFKNNQGKIKAELIINENGINKIINRKVDFDEFLVNKHETATEKYGDILNKIIELTNRKEG